MNIYIRKRSFFEIAFPLTVVFFVCIGTRFVNAVGASHLRWVFVFLLFLYLWLNKKLLIHINYRWKILLFIYLVWCVSTILWSEVPLVTISKSSMFTFNIIVMLSAGSLWVIKFGFERSLDWLLLILAVALSSGFLGGAAEGSIDPYDGFNLYSGLSGGANDFGFMLAIATPLLFWKLYQYKTNKLRFVIWFSALVIDIHFLLASYSRSSIVIFTCVLAFFSLSLPLSKKILVSISSFFFIIIVLIITPVSYLENMVTNHIIKSNGSIIDPNSSAILQSRSLVWKQSYQQAEKGGIIGGGFSVTIGDKNFSDKNLDQNNGAYGREKGNSQLAIMEETGIIGLVLYAIMLLSFIAYVIPYYLRMKGSDKVAMGVVLGAIFGLLLESIVEGWWDSAAAPELIYFWTLVGVAHGMIYLDRSTKN